MTRRGALLLLLFGLALGIRLAGLSEGRMVYHPTKQYRSAMTTRAYYFEEAEGIADWRRDVARDGLRRIGIIAPTPQEVMIAKLYLWSGAERVWFGQLYSVLAWLVGGGFLFVLARRLASFGGAYLGTAFYLLAPFGIVSSRSFQPDPPMVGAIAASLWFAMRYHERPGVVRLLLAAGSSALAVFIKPISIFLVAAGYAGAGIGLDSLHGRRRWLEFGAFVLISFLPSLGFYLYRILVPGYSDWKRETSFLPRFMLEFRFWDGWLKRIRLSLGFTYLAAGLAGLFLARERLVRSLLLSLWAGYVLMCLSVSYKISTHDYYHLPLIPVVALSLAPLVDALLARVDAASKLWRWGAWATAGLGIFLAAGSAVQAERRVPSEAAEIAVAREIGNRVQNSISTIHLAPFYGRPLMYHAEISGRHWPYHWDLNDEYLWKRKTPTAAERLSLMQEEEAVDFFIIQDRTELAMQPELERELRSFPILADEPEYLIFDLRRSLP